ncbi:unnamed protein product [Haemonchus placei]|uniref:TLDc domain-containing protein n=1 Tax=Haemonchus placei TaxID=6290 RepID=A0A0N4W9F6_HAEPC|nr:unnamed protein product [Haemonchus placei]
MGNTEAKAKLSKTSTTAPSMSDRSIDKRVEQAFVKLTGSTSNYLTFGNLKDVFSEGLAESLWNYLSDSKPYDDRLTLDEFARHAPSLWGTSTDVYVKVCQPVLTLVKNCSEAAGAGAVAGDEKFIGNLVHEMVREQLGLSSQDLFLIKRSQSYRCERGSSVEEIVSWKRDMCPAFCNALRDLVLHVFLGYAFVRILIMEISDNTEYSSEILTPMQMWYVQSSLQSTFFPKQSAKEACESNVNHSWTPLYSTAVHGISVNRFENNVFDYRGPTVSIFQLTDGSIFVLATEDTWRHSGSRFGGQATVLFEISPDLKRFSSPSPPIYCNFKIRSAAFGLSFLDKMKIDKEMGNVAAIEVWGCAPSSALQDQQRLRAWQNKQAEKIKKVPLPGNWDDNPDKTILEMAGIQFSNERKLMEMEAKARQNDNL